MNIYIPLTKFANRPTTKTWREMRAAFPQVHSRTVSLDQKFLSDSDGNPLDPGVVLMTDSDPEPDEAAIRALVTAHDGSEDPPLVGLMLPTFQTAFDLPDQPPGISEGRAYAAIVLVPLGIHVYADDRWNEI